MPTQTLHRWWYEHLLRAELVPADAHRGMNMHRSRHTVATELRREVGDVGIAKGALGAEDVSTTERFYGHYDLSDPQSAQRLPARRMARARSRCNFDPRRTPRSFLLCSLPCHGAAACAAQRPRRTARFGHRATAQTLAALGMSEG